MDEALPDVVHEGHVGLAVKPGLEGGADLVGLLRAVGEQVDDLQYFKADEFVSALFE